MDRHFDYIIAGTGLAGLQLALKMSQDSFFKGKKILLIDKNRKEANDRTWCFWESEKGKWDHILFHQWKKAGFYSKTIEEEFDVNYKMIRGIDFYEYAHNTLIQNKQFTFVYEKIIGIIEKDKVVVSTPTQEFTADYCFDSTFNYEQYSKKHIPVLQHFVGWFIQTEEDIFDAETVHFMDFRVNQQDNTRFMYVLPFSKNTALIEYTLFSGDVLEKKEYENEIKSYLKEKNITNYKLIEKENGVIPMTCYPFEKKGTKHIIKIGTAGGWTKASTGFTFKSIENKVEKLVTQIKDNNVDGSKLINKRHRLYDLLLLQILIDHNEQGSYIFSKLFERNTPHQIFKFLDERTNLLEEVSIILKSPPMPFIKAIGSILF